MTAPRRPLISCTGKHRYGSSAEARAVIRARQAEARQPHHAHKEAKRKRAGMTCYQCRYCQGWHIGGAQQ